MSKEEKQLEHFDPEEAAPQRGNGGNIVQGNTTEDHKSVKSSGLQLAPASEDYTSEDATPAPVAGASPSKGKDDRPQYTPTLSTHTPSNRSAANTREGLQLAPGAIREPPNTEEIDEEQEDEATTASDAVEAFVPRDRTTTTRNHRRSHDIASNHVLVDGVNVSKVEREDGDRRQLCFGALALFLLVALIVGVSVGVTQSSSQESKEPVTPTESPSTAPSDEPSLSPTSTPSSFPTTTSYQVITNDLALDFGPSTILALQNASSPQSQAARWMMDEDQALSFPLNDTGPESVVRRRFRQRYALATLYFSTGGDTSWITRGSFLSPTLHECDWGITVADRDFSLLSCYTQCDVFEFQNVLEVCDNQLPVPALLTFWKNGMTGRIPEEIGALTSTLAIVFGYNFLSGSIPVEIYNLPYLSVLGLEANLLTGSLSGAGVRNFSSMLHTLDVSDNHLTGTLPSEISVMTQLDRLHLAANLFRGTIPSDWHQNLSNLQWYDLSQCMLTGSLPSSMGRMSRLEFIRVAWNEFNGTLPTELASISTLTQLWANHNQFIGTLPKEYAASSSLALMFASSNRLTGTIPSKAWLNAKNLTELSLHDNAFTGTIPSELGSIDGIMSLRVGSPGLTGTIPTELGNLGSSLALLSIKESPGLQGTIPSELGTLTKLTELRLHENDLSGSIPSQVASASNLTVLSVYSNPRLMGSLPKQFAAISPQIVEFEMTNMTGNTSVICDRYQPDAIVADCLKVYCPCCTLCYANESYRSPWSVNGDRL